MNSFLTVNNNVSLVSINVAPSTYLASFIILIVFLALYLPQLSLRIPRPRFSLPQFLRQDRTAPNNSRPSATLTAAGGEAPPQGRGFYRDHCEYDRLGGNGFELGSQLILQDQSLVLSRPDLVPFQGFSHASASASSSSSAPGTAQTKRDGGRSSSSRHENHHHERDPRSRRPRRLLEGPRTPAQPRVPAPLGRAQRGRDDDGRRGGGGGAAGRVRRQGSPGLGDRFRRWVFAAGVAEARPPVASPPETSGGAGTPPPRRSSWRRTLERAR